MQVACIAVKTDTLHHSPNQSENVPNRSNEILSGFGKEETLESVLYLEEEEGSTEPRQCPACWHLDSISLLQ